MNFEGWHIKEWIQHNKENLRLIVAGFTGLATAGLSGLSPVWAGALGVVITGVSKLLLDTLDYGFS